MTSTAIPSLASLLADYDNLDLLPSNRIRCKLTGHEMPPTAKAVYAYLNGKSYINAKKWYSADFSSYEPDIVPHKTDPKKLYCTITEISLNRIKDEVEKHINGRKFQNAKKAAIEAKEKKALKAARAAEKHAAWEAEKAARAEKGEASDDESEPDCWMPDFPIDGDSEEEDENEENNDAESDDEQEDVESGEEDVESGEEDAESDDNEDDEEEEEENIVDEDDDEEEEDRPTKKARIIAKNLPIETVVEASDKPMSRLAQKRAAKAAANAIRRANSAKKVDARYQREDEEFIIRTTTADNKRKARAERKSKN